MAKRIDEPDGRRQDEVRRPAATGVQRLDDGGLKAVRIAGDEAQRKAMQAWRRGLARDPEQDRG